MSPHIAQWQLTSSSEQLIVSNGYKLDLRIIKFDLYYEIASRSGHEHANVLTEELLETQVFHAIRNLGDLQRGQ